MSWSRPPVAAALVNLLTAATGGTVTVFEHPPNTLNAPAVVVARVERVVYSTVALNVDDVTLPVLAVGAADADDAVSTLAETIRKTVLANPSLSGSVQVAYPYEQRNWRNVVVAGVDLLTVEVALSIQM